MAMLKSIWTNVLGPKWPHNYKLASYCHDQHVSLYFLALPPILSLVHVMSIFVTAVTGNSLLFF